MKLGSIAGGRLYATHGRQVLVSSGPDAHFERRGRLPDPPAGPVSLRSRFETGPLLKRAVGAVVGTFPTENLWHVTDDDLLATVGRHLYSSHDGGWTWSHRRPLPPSSGTMGVLPTAVCVDDGRVYLGEYPLDETTPRLLASDDRGRSWTTVLALPEVRHVHGVHRDPYTGDVWLTTGDRDAECRIGRLRDGEFRTVGSGSQQWRAVDLAFTRDAVLWGVDSALVRRNNVLRLPRTEIGRNDPVPDPVYETARSFYYGASWSAGDARYVAFSTAIGTRPDRTAPDDHDGPTGREGSNRFAQVVVSSSASDFTKWQPVATYRKRRRPVDWLPWSSAPSANAYVFLVADNERGLVHNPYNTRCNAGKICVGNPPASVPLPSAKRRHDTPRSRLSR